MLLKASRQLELAPLTAAETRELVVSLFDDVPNVDLLASLLHQSAKGVPRRVMQAAEACLQQELVRYVAGSFCIARETAGSSAERVPMSLIADWRDSIWPASSSVASR